MPPKLADKKAKSTILKFKRGKSTYVIPIDLTAKSAKTATNFVRLLCNMINLSGGLVEETSDGDEGMEDDIVVPKSEFLDEDEEEEETGNKPTAQSVDEADVRLGVPKDKTQPYNNEWVAVDDKILADISFNDYDLLAFAVGDEDFGIVEAAYEE